MFHLKWFRRSAPPRPDPAPAPVPSKTAGFDLLFSKQPVTKASAETVVLIGNCIAETMARGLATSPVATKQFQFFAVPLHLKTIDDEDVRRAIGVAKAIFAQGVAKSHRQAIDALRASDSRILEFPDLVLRSAWPFDHQSGHIDKRVPPEIPVYEHDGALAALRQIEPDKGARFRRYRDLDFDLAGRIERTIEAQQRFNEDIDRSTETNLGRFISRRLGDSQLFYNSTHPSGVLYQELCSFCWRQLGLSGEPPPFADMDGWRQQCIPIHPTIARRLDLKWANELTRYHCGALGPLTWDQWVRSYIDRFG